MSRRRTGSCGAPGPYAAHCSNHRGHDYSCYDASEDVSFNHRHEFTHACPDLSCPDFYNEGD